MTMGRLTEAEVLLQETVHLLILVTREYPDARLLDHIRKICAFLSPEKQVTP